MFLTILVVMVVILMLLYNGGVLDNTGSNGCNTNVVMTMVVFLYWFLTILV